MPSFSIFGCIASFGGLYRYDLSYVDLLHLVLSYFI